MILLEGKKLSEEILENIKKEIEENNLKLRLAIILIGKNSSSELFIKQKEKACKNVGIDFKLFKFGIDIDFDKLKKEINRICKDKNNSGVVVQLPLPNKFKNKEQEILNLIPSRKDPDVLSQESLAKFLTDDSFIMPPVVRATSYLFYKYGINPKGKNVVIIGSGKLVGLPLSLWMIKKYATVSIINKFTKDISFFTKKSDILICGVGRPKVVIGSMTKKGIVVVDVGISFRKGKIIGDVDFKTVSKKAGYITPVPGGIGPLTVVSLLENLVKLNKNNYK